MAKQIEKILWGDDDAGILKLFQFNLEHAFKENKLKVDTATNPEEVVSKAMQNSYDLIITDLNYTHRGREGFDVIRKVQGLAQYVILCSGSIDETVEETAKEAGAYGAIDKLLSVKEIINYIKALK
jgi:DNA-binding response OmpR family regulator